jgi:hypothetical protein
MLEKLGLIQILEKKLVGTTTPERPTAGLYTIIFWKVKCGEKFIEKQKPIPLYNVL